MADAQDDSRGESRQSFFVKQQLINTAKTAFQQMSAVLKNTTLYPEEHPSLVTSAQKLLATIEYLLVGRKEVAFYLVSGEIFFETHSLPLDQSLTLLMEQFIVRDVGGIIFKPGLMEREIIKFAGLMSQEPSFFVSQGGIREVIFKEGITHIELHRVLLVGKDTGSAMKEGEKKATEIFLDAVDAVKEMVHAMHLDKAVNVRKINTTVQAMVDNILENRDALMGLTSIKMYDEYTFAHSVNTAILSISLGTFLSFEKPQVAALGMAALLHDMGKVNVPLDIINKPDKLTEQEWDVVKRHPIEGALILSDTPAVTKLAMVAAFEHHQHGDVRGYPLVDGRFQQHPFSQIVSLADAYEAITAARVYYKVRISPEHAIRILIKKEDAFDPTIVKTFINMIGIFPISTLLKLDTGEIGLVLHQTRDLLRPRVLLLSKFDGSEKKEGEEVSLLETAGGRYKRSVVGIIDPSLAKIDMRKYFQ